MYGTNRIVNWICWTIGVVMILVPPVSVDSRVGKKLALYKTGEVREVVGERHDAALGRVVHEVRDLPKGPIVVYRSLVFELSSPLGGGALAVLNAISYGRLAGQLIALLVLRLTFFPFLVGIRTRFRAEG